MTDFRTSAIAFLCVAGLLALAGPVAGAAVSTMADGDAAVTDKGTNNSSMGAEISAFMQSSASETDGAVEDGMFEAAYENGSADDRADLVRNRTGDLQNELADLRERRQRLQEDRENMSQIEYQTRMSRLASDIRSLERAANRTQPLAEEAGVNTTALREIRTNASNLTGEEVSALAQQLAVVPDHVDQGPPENRGPGDGNNSAGEPDDGGAGEENDSAGSPDDNGNGEESSDGTQTGDEDDEDSEDEEGNDNSRSGGGSGSGGSEGDDDAGNGG